MFDERNDIWILLFKGLTIFEFFGSILGGLITAIAVEGFWIFLVGISAAFVFLVVNMVLIQFFSNVQTIRERMEVMEYAESRKPEPAAVYLQTPAYPQPAAPAPAAPAAAAPSPPAAPAAASPAPVFVAAVPVPPAPKIAKCPACGAEYVGDLPFCKKCGTPREMTRREPGWTCPACGFKNKPTAPFCKGCGKGK